MAGFSASDAVAPLPPLVVVGRLPLVPVDWDPAPVVRVVVRALPALLAASVALEMADEAPPIPSLMSWLTSERMLLTAPVASLRTEETRVGISPITEVASPMMLVAPSIMSETTPGSSWAYRKEQLLVPRCN